MLIRPRLAVLATSLLVAAPWLAATPAQAQIAVIALENKVVLVNGVATVVANPKPDGAALLDLSATPPKLIAQIELPSATVQGPPTTVAVTPDESMAIVGSGQRADCITGTLETTGTNDDGNCIYRLAASKYRATQTTPVMSVAPT